MPVIRGNKPIQLIRIDDASDWDDVKALTGDFLLPQDLGGLKQLLDGFVRSVYIEEIVSDKRVGLSRLRPPGLPPDDSLIRLFLTSSRSWKRNCRGSRIPGGLGLLYSAMPMPRFIWVAELSTRALYPDGWVLGEILIDATASSRDDFAFLSIHYPGILILNNRHSLSESLASRTSVLNISPHSTYRLYRNNLEEIRYDQERTRQDRTHYACS